jgi:hypothetical protein
MKNLFLVLVVCFFSFFAASAQESVPGILSPDSKKVEVILNRPRVVYRDRYITPPTPAPIVRQVVSQDSLKNAVRQVLNEKNSKPNRFRDEFLFDFGVFSGALLLILLGFGLYMLGRRDRVQGQQPAIHVHMEGMAPNWNFNPTFNPTHNPTFIPTARDIVDKTMRVDIVGVGIETATPAPDAGPAPAGNPSTKAQVADVLGNQTASAVADVPRV